MNPVLESIPLGEENTIIGFKYEASEFKTPWHFHPQHELTYIEESIGTKSIGAYVGSYEPGELVLLRSNLPHCWKNIQNERAKAKSIVVQWNKGIFPKIPELKRLFNMLKVASKGILFNKKDAELLLPLIQKLTHLKGQELYILLLTLLSELSTCDYITLSKTSFVDYLPEQYGSRMATVHDFISENYYRKIYLKEPANLAHMSEQSFSRFFTKMMGRPFFTYLNEYRIQLATRMLLGTDHTVSQIGFECGYDSLPFFYRQFKKFMGCSPMVYQKKYK